MKGERHYDKPNLLRSQLRTYYKRLTQRRLDIQHHLWALTLEGKLGLSPPHEKGASPERVLDVGTGTGSWAM